MPATGSGPGPTRTTTHCRTPPIRTGASAPATFPRRRATAPTTSRSRPCARGPRCLPRHSDQHRDQDDQDADGDRWRLSDAGHHPYCDDPAASVPVADALADLLDELQYASRTDIIVVSFSDALIDEFHARDEAPQVALAPGVD